MRSCRYLLFCCITLLPCVLFGQVRVKASADKSSLLIGEPLHLTLEAYIPIGSDLEWQEPDTLTNFVFLHRGILDTIRDIESFHLVQQFRLTSFDSGQQVISPLSVIVDGAVYRSDSLIIAVSYAPFDSAADYRDVKPIIDIPHPYAKYIPWAIGLISLLCLAALYLLLRRRPVADTAPAVALDTRSSYEKAMDQLDKLNAGASLPAEIKLFYTSLNTILREYIGDRIAVQVNEKTNMEILRGIRPYSLDKDSFSSLAEALHISDFVKFARYLPQQEDNKRNLMIIRDAIRSLHNSPT